MNLKSFRWFVKTNRCKPPDFFEDLGSYRGEKVENKFFAVMESVPVNLMPEWFICVRRATLVQDLCEGVDVLVDTTDAGVLYLQIKSSQKEAENFRESDHYKNKIIGLVVINERSSVHDVYWESKKNIEETRQRTLRAGVFNIE